MFMRTTFAIKIQIVSLKSYRQTDHFCLTRDWILRELHHLKTQNFRVSKTPFQAGSKLRMHYPQLSIDTFFTHLKMLSFQFSHPHTCQY